MEENGALEENMGYLGEFGKYQRKQVFYLCLAPFMAGIHTMTFTTVAGIPKHRCLLPGESTDDPLPWDAVQVSSWIPTTKDGRLDSCRIYESPGRNVTKPCTEWVFDHTLYATSRVIEWEMVCDRGWMRAIAQSVFMVGVLAGAVVLGSLADRVGRKKVLCACTMLQLIVCSLSAFIQDYKTSVVLLFFLGSFGSSGLLNGAFVLTMELVGPSKRTICGIAQSAAFDMGTLVVALWAWLIPDRFTLQLVYALHSLLLLGHWWLVDESPRWLWTHGERAAAQDIIRKGLKTNGVELVVDDILPSAKTLQQEEQDSKPKRAGLLSLVRTPNMRRRTLIVAFNWFANSLAYYGLSLNTDSLPGNPFLMLSISCMVPLPTYMTVAYLMDRFGRRRAICSFMMAGGFACLISVFINVDSVSGRIAYIASVMIGKSLVAGAFALVYNYTAELFPTVCRASALGLGSMHARISGTLTPLIILLGTVDITLPTLIFSATEVAAGLLSLLLPETLHHSIPETLEDGEQFGIGDTACSLRRKKKLRRLKADEEQIKEQPEI